MVVEKDKVCKDCGCLTVEKKCPNCGGSLFLDKYKGKVVIFDAQNSEIAKKLNKKSNGRFALKYS